MPNVSITAGAIMIEGSRSILPHTANQFSPIKPLIVDIGSGTIGIYTISLVSTLLNNQSVSSAGSQLIDTTKLQSLNAEIAFISNGSIEFSIFGYQAIASIATSTIVSTGWLTSSVLAGVTMSSPSALTSLGQNALVVWNVGTVTATNVSMVLTQTI